MVDDDGTSMKEIRRSVLVTHVKVLGYKRPSEMEDGRGGEQELGVMEEVKMETMDSDQGYYDPDVSMRQCKGSKWSDGNIQLTRYHDCSSAVN